MLCILFLLALFCEKNIEALKLPNDLPEVLALSVFSFAAFCICATLLDSGSVLELPGLTMTEGCCLPGENQKSFLLFF